MNLSNAKKLVFSQKPIFAKLYEEYKDKTWLDYARDNFPKQSKFVSSADHHGILCHPFFTNSALLRSHPLSKQKNIISLTCGGVSLSNSSYPRGIFFHDQNLQEIRLPFISLHNRHLPVYGHPAITKETFVKQMQRIYSYSLPKTARNKLLSFMKSVILADNIWQQQYLSDQFTAINHLLWKTIFNRRGNLIYLESESYVRQLLLDKFMAPNTIVHQILFEKEIRNLYLKGYEGIAGAHSKNKKGTHFFWFIDRKKNTRRQLWVINEQLQTEDKQISIPLEAEVIRKHLETYQLLPSMALSYSILTFIEGYTLGGGFSQIQYLGEMKAAFSKLSEPAKTRTDIFTGEFVAIGVGNKTAAAPATLVDILLWGGDNPGEVIDKQLATISVGASLDLMIPQLLPIIAGKRSVITGLPPTPKTFYVDR